MIDVLGRQKESGDLYLDALSAAIDEHIYPSYCPVNHLQKSAAGNRVNDNDNP